MKMRILLLAIALLSVGSLVSATYASKTVENYTAYANSVSRTFSLGDGGDDSGWRECVQMENNETNIGLACEGVRSILVHGGRMFDVNYYCEFRFVKKAELKFVVETESCQ